MKNTLIRTAAAAAIAAVMMGLAACSAKPAETSGNAPEVISGGTAATTISSEGGSKNTPVAGDTFSLNYNGVALAPGMELDEAVKQLGDGFTKTADQQACAFDAAETTYYNKDIILYADNRDGKFKINTIEVRDPSVDCGGVKVGAAAEDVKKVYGDPSLEEIACLRYEKGGTQLQFVMGDDKKVISILFKNT